MVVFAKQALAQAAVANLTAHNIVDSLVAEGGNPNIQSKPNPTDPPSFQYPFNIQFHSSCTVDQREVIVTTLANIAGLADRVQLWETDVFHDWQNEVSYWFGDDSPKYDTYIKSEAPQKLRPPIVGIRTEALSDNFLRMSRAVEIGKTGWINTWVYIGCGYNWGVGALTCSQVNNWFNFGNIYGWLRYWVSLLARKTQWKHASDQPSRIQFTGISAPASGRNLMSNLKSLTH